jgi:hypothetical protein
MNSSHLLGYKRRVVRWKSADVSDMSPSLKSKRQTRKQYETGSKQSCVLASRYELVSCLTLRSWRLRQYIPPKCRAFSELQWWYKAEVCIPRVWYELGGSRFKSRSPHRLSWFRFLVDFPSHSRQVLKNTSNYGMAASFHIFHYHSITRQITNSLSIQSLSASFNKLQI